MLLSALKTSRICAYLLGFVQNYPTCSQFIERTSQKTGRTIQTKVKYLRTFPQVIRILPKTVRTLVKTLRTVGKWVQSSTYYVLNGTYCLSICVLWPLKVRTVCIWGFVSLQMPLNFLSCRLYSRYCPPLITLNWFTWEPWWSNTLALGLRVFLSPSG